MTTFFLPFLPTVPFMLFVFSLSRHSFARNEVPLRPVFIRSGLSKPYVNLPEAVRERYANVIASLKQPSSTGAVSYTASDSVEKPFILIKIPYDPSAARTSSAHQVHDDFGAVADAVLEAAPIECISARDNALCIDETPRFGAETK